ncbi:hypothetical protein LCGC14_0313090 [marine sediment metagenome]|uniref:Uncharacterized protein n=1 Tax=marine sediment metagenome TaxID=412755 RepID=A0A0F9U404_9ZZZZ
MDLLGEAHEHAQQLAERFSHEIYASVARVDFSNGYATLKIDMSLITTEQRHMVYEAERLLRSAGVEFDVNSGKGFRNWELDWSLSGATLQVRPIVCCHVTCMEPVVDPFWSCLQTASARVVAYAYCSASHQDKDVRRLEEMGWICLICDVA